LGRFGLDCLREPRRRGLERASNRPALLRARGLERRLRILAHWRRRTFGQCLELRDEPIGEIGRRAEVGTSVRDDVDGPLGIVAKVAARVAVGDVLVEIRRRASIDYGREVLGHVRAKL
jgi:hypothetical protein